MSTLAVFFAVFFAGAITGAGITFLAMCFAFCAGRMEREDKDDEDVQ